MAITTKITVKLLRAPETVRTLLADFPSVRAAGDVVSDIVSAGIEQRVHPTMVPKDTAIAQVMGVTNAVTVDADAIAPITLVGAGAGGMATASAVVSDIGDIARGVRTAPFGRPTAQLVRSGKAPMQRHEGGYYIRLLARDRPGSAATIAKRLAQQNISLESIVQRQTAKTQSTAAPGRRDGSSPAAGT